jgi:hypothetical protein
VLIHGLDCEKSSAAMVPKSSSNLHDRTATRSRLRRERLEYVERGNDLGEDLHLRARRSVI